MTPNRAHERLAERLVRQRGMDPATARNAVAHVAQHGADSPWAREVQAAAVRELLAVHGEFVQAALRPLAEAVRRARTSGTDTFALAPPASQPARERRRPVSMDEDDFQDRGDAARLAAGIDGTAGDAQDIPHVFQRDTPHPWCLLCGLAPDYRKHTTLPRA